MDERPIHEDDADYFLTVSQVASRSGVAISTIHFYESIGLIESRRNRSNHRRYRADVLRRVAIVKVGQRAGMTLESIREALAQLPADRAPTAQDWRRLSMFWRDELDQRITRLVRLRDQLTDCIGCGCLSLDVCALRNPDDELSAEGPGPRLLDPDPT